MQLPYFCNMRFGFRILIPSMNCTKDQLCHHSLTHPCLSQKVFWNPDLRYDFKYIKPRYFLSQILNHVEIGKKKRWIPPSVGQDLHIISNNKFKCLCIEKKTFLTNTTAKYCLCVPHPFRKLRSLHGQTQGLPLVHRPTDLPWYVLGFKYTSSAALSNVFNGQVWVT